MKRAFVYAAAAVAAAVALVILALILPPVRDLVLSKAIDAAGERLPGSLTARERAWRLPLTLELGDVLWARDGTAGGGARADRRAGVSSPGEPIGTSGTGSKAAASDTAAKVGGAPAAASDSAATLQAAAMAETLLVARWVTISIDPLALLRRDVSVKRLLVDGLSADIPAIRALFPAGGPDTAAVERTAAGERRFPRSGSVGGLPSVAADEVRLTGRSIVISPGATLDEIGLSGSFDFREGRRPRARLDALTVRAKAGSDVFQAPRIDSADLTIDVAEGRLQGTAAGALSPELPFYLDVVSDKRDSFTMTLGAAQGERPFEHTGLELEGTLIRTDGQVSGLSFDAALLTPGTLELSSIPALAPRLEGYPDLEGIPAELHGSVTFEPSIAMECRADIRSNSWLEGGAARVAYDENALTLQELSLEMPDLTLRANGALAPDSVRATAQLEASGARWLGLLAPGVTPPESLALHLTAEVAGPRAAPLVQASLDAAARAGGFTLDELSVTARTPSAEAGGAQPPMRGTLYVRALRTELATTVELSPPETSSKRIAAVLTPLVVRESAGDSSVDQKRMLDLSRAAAGALGRCAVEIRPIRRGVSVENLRLTGGLGELRADGELGAGSQGSFAVNWTWPKPPSLLLARAGLARGLADSLRARWPAEEAPRLAVRGTLDGIGAQLAVSASGQITLPGPAELAPLLPAGARVDDLGPIIGDLSFAARRARSSDTAQGSRAAPAGDGATFEARLDLGRTAWIDTAVVSLRGTGPAITIDSARVALEGLSLDLAGTIDRGYFDLLSNLDLADARIVRRFHPALSQDVSAELSARAAFKGTRSSPRAEASFAGSARAPGYAVPRLEGVASWKKSGLSAKIHAPDGLVVGPLQLDSLRASYAVEDTSGAVFPGSFVLSAGGERLQISHSGVLRRLAAAEGARGPGTGGKSVPSRDAQRGEPAQGRAGAGAAGWLIETESFAIALEGSDLRSTSPFEISLLPEGAGVSIEGLNLAGTLGVLTADGYASRSESNLSLKADLTLPEDPPFIEVTEGLWPRGLEITVAATEEGALRAAAAARGLALGDRRDLVARISAEGGRGSAARPSAEGMDVGMILSAGADTLLDAGGRLPLSISLFPPGASFGDGQVSITATARALPLPMSTGGQTMIAPSDRTAALDCGVELAGTSKRPWARVDGAVTFPDWPKLYKYRANFGALMRSAEAGEESEGSAGRSPGARGAGSAAGAARSAAGTIPALEGSGLAATFVLEREGKRPASGTLLLPMTWSLLPFEFRLDEAREMDLRVQADQVELANFDNLLPPKYGLKGKCSFNVAATGPPGDPELSGKLTASGAGVAIEDGTHVTAGADIDLAGTRLNPSLAGKIEIQNGVIVIPERSKKLLPTSGQAALWELESVKPGGRLDFDSLAEASSPSQVRRELQTVPEPPKTKLELDVAVEIPSALWVRGRGLDVGLAGDLRLVQRGELPTITGELEAVQGRFVFLGQTFAVERGKAVFYGGDEINPSLDILLTTTVEATQIQITLVGSVNDPKLQLSSIPELPEGDIMSLLVFGRTMDQLDNDQMALLGSRAADIATAFGTAQLEAKLARQLGVDVLRIKTESEQAGGSSVVIGKYISTRVLLKYEQALGDRARFFVNLEYLLTQHFRLETLIGHESQSAVELNWTKEH
jgi:autotransporter translocation and assembly factor TamB